MSYFIIIRGPLGVGKTAIAKKLAKRLNAKYISFDRVLEENKLDKVNNDFVPEDFIKANKIIIPGVKKALSEGKIVILDGCFYFKEQIKHLGKNLLNKEVKGYVFNLKSPLAICIERDNKRQKVYGEKAAKEVYELVSKFNYGISINTDKKTENDVVKEILNHLKTR